MPIRLLRERMLLPQMSSANASRGDWAPAPILFGASDPFVGRNDSTKSHLPEICEIITPESKFNRGDGKETDGGCRELEFRRTQGATLRRAG